MVSRRITLLTSLLGLLGLGLWLSASAPERNSSPVTVNSEAAEKLPGVVGDGKTDDTAALQAIINRRGTIDFPKGTYRITKPLVIDLDQTGYAAITADGTATLLMAGAGPAIRFIGSHQGTAAPETVKPEIWDRQRTPRISNLEIVGAHPEADGIEASGTMQLSIHGVTIRRCRHGIHLVQRNRNVLISACHIYENSGIGIYYDDVNLHQSNIVGCHISYCGGGGVVCRAGEVRNVHIGTCDIEGCMAKDGPPAANVFIDCRGGSTAEVAITGCTIQHSNVPGAANIRVIGAGKATRAGENPRWGHITIGDNVLSDVAVNIDLRDCRGVSITGNTFWMGYEANLRVESSEQIAVGPNLFERNPAYNYGTSNTTKNGVEFRSCRDCTLTGLHLQGVRAPEAALLLDDCQRFNVSGCSILDCDGIGVLLRNCRNTRVSDCLIRHDGDKKAATVTLKMIGGAGNLLADNLLGRPAEVLDTVEKP